MKEKIYVLIDPISLKVRYIGITRQELKERLDNHIHDAKYRPEWNWHKSRWINKLLLINNKPIIRLLKICENREEAELLEEELINKYKDKHKLTNIAIDSSKFDSTSAAEFLSKQVFVYDYQGNYIESYKSIKECSYELQIYYSTVKKCLRGEYKYAKQFQFSLEKVEKMPNLTEYSTGSSKEVILLDTFTDEILRFKSKVDCCKKLNIIVKSTGHKYLLGALNKEFGNRYRMLVDGNWEQSTYYNTGVIIELLNETVSFLTKKEFLSSIGINNSVTEKKFNELINKTYNNAVNIKTSQPQCEVIHIRKSRELLETP